MHHLELELTDGQRGLWRSLSLGTARHGSETPEYFVTRLLAWALHWTEGIEVRAGLCLGNEPALWVADPMGGYRLWIDVGRPDSDRLRHAVARAEEVLLYACPADETALAAWKSKAFQGRRLPRFFLPPKGLVDTAAEHLERRIEWHLQRDGDDLLLALPGATLEGTLIEVHLGPPGRQRPIKGRPRSSARCSLGPGSPARAAQSAHLAAPDDCRRSADRLARR